MTGITRKPKKKNATTDYSSRSFAELQKKKNPKTDILNNLIFNDDITKFFCHLNINKKKK